MSFCKAFLIFFICILIISPLEAHFFKDLHYFSSRYDTYQIDSSYNNPNNMLGLRSSRYRHDYLMGLNFEHKDGLHIRLLPRVSIDKTNRSENVRTRIDLQEYAIGINIKNKVFLDYGEKALRWGQSFAWDILNIFDDANSFIESRLNYDKIFHVQGFFDHNIGFSYVHFFNKNREAFKLSKDFYKSTISVYNIINDNYLEIGADVSFTLNDATVFYSEFTFQNDPLKITPKYNAKDKIYYWEKKRKENEWLPRSIIGMQYTFLNGTNLIIEYFYNPIGMNKDEADLVNKGIIDALAQIDNNRLASAKEFLGNYAKTHELFYARQHYFFIRIKKENLVEKLTGAIGGFYSLSDNGFFLLPDLSLNISRNTKVSASAKLPLGGKGVEFKKFFAGEVKLAIKHSFE